MLNWLLGRCSRGTCPFIKLNDEKWEDIFKARAERDEAQGQLKNARTLNNQLMERLTELSELVRELSVQREKNEKLEKELKSFRDIPVFKLDNAWGKE